MHWFITYEAYKSIEKFNLATHSAANVITAVTVKEKIYRILKELSYIGALCHTYVLKVIIKFSIIHLPHTTTTELDFAVPAQSLLSITRLNL